MLEAIVIVVIVVVVAHDGKFGIGKFGKVGDLVKSGKVKSRFKRSLNREKRLESMIFGGFKRKFALNQAYIAQWFF